MTRVFGINFLAMTSFYLLLSVVPMYSGGTGAGLATGVLMLATVAAELVSPRFVARYGYRRVLAVGLVLLGAPAFALPATKDAILVVCLLRGVGFAIVVVVNGALVATLLPPERRGEGLGLYGVVANVPAVVALPLGVWFAGHIGFPPVFLAGGAVALAGLAAVSGLPQRPQEPEQALGVLGGLRTPALVRPATVFAAVTMAAGVVVTFLPAATGSVAAAALLAQAAMATVTRWWAGRYADRHGAAGLLAPAAVLVAVGALALVWATSPVVVLSGMAVFGAGFGIAQNASLSMMYDRMPASAYGTVSAVWNIAYDGGLGIGAIGFGALAAWTGFPLGFAVTALLVLVAMPLVRRPVRVACAA